MRVPLICQFILLIFSGCLECTVLPSGGDSDMALKIIGNHLRWNKGELVMVDYALSICHRLDYSLGKLTLSRAKYKLAECAIRVSSLCNKRRYVLHCNSAEAEVYKLVCGNILFDGKAENGPITKCKWTFLLPNNVNVLLQMQQFSSRYRFGVCIHELKIINGRNVTEHNICGLRQPWIITLKGNTVSLNLVSVFKHKNALNNTSFETDWFQIKMQSFLVFPKVELINVRSKDVKEDVYTHVFGTIWIHNNKALKTYIYILRAAAVFKLKIGINKYLPEHILAIFYDGPDMNRRISYITHMPVNSSAHICLVSLMTDGKLSKININVSIIYSSVMHKYSEIQIVDTTTINTKTLPIGGKFINSVTVFRLLSFNTSILVSVKHLFFHFFENEIEMCRYGGLSFTVHRPENWVMYSLVDWLTICSHDAILARDYFLPTNSFITIYALQNRQNISGLLSLKPSNCQVAFLGEIMWNFILPLYIPDLLHYVSILAYDNEKLAYVYISERLPCLVGQHQFRKYSENTRFTVMISPHENINETTQKGRYKYIMADSNEFWTIKTVQKSVSITSAQNCLSRYEEYNTTVMCLTSRRQTEQTSHKSWFILVKEFFRGVTQFMISATKCQKKIHDHSSLAKDCGGSMSKTQPGNKHYLTKLKSLHLATKTLLRMSLQLKFIFAFDPRCPVACHSSNILQLTLKWWRFLKPLRRPAEYMDYEEHFRIRLLRKSIIQEMHILRPLKGAMFFGLVFNVALEHMNNTSSCNVTCNFSYNILQRQIPIMSLYYNGAAKTIKKSKSVSVFNVSHWSRILYTDMQYHFIPVIAPTKLSWLSANKQCSEHGGALAAVFSYSEFKDLYRQSTFFGFEDYVPLTVYIGLTWHTVGILFNTNSQWAV